MRIIVIACFKEFSFLHFNMTSNLKTLSCLFFCLSVEWDHVDIDVGKKYSLRKFMPGSRIRGLTWMMTGIIISIFPST